MKMIIWRGNCLKIEARVEHHHDHVHVPAPIHPSNCVNQIKNWGNSKIWEKQKVPIETNSCSFFPANLKSK